MADIIPGVNLGGQTSNIMTTLITLFGYFVAALVTGGAAFGIYWLLNEKIFKFKIPVTLKFEVGGAIIKKSDMIWIKRSGSKWEVKFKSNTKLIAQIPPDECAFFIGKKKTFEGFVRNNQVAWVWPSPQTKVVQGAFELTDGKGNITTVPEQVIETFQTIPTNMTESYIHTLSKNAALLTKKKWYQDPMIMQWAMMGVFLTVVIFMYLMMKNIPDLVNGYLTFAKTIASGCSAVQIK
jgi:hypothetical protein